MPSRNVIKPYVAGGIYHIYNRGVEKRIVFMDDQDHFVFLKYLREAVSAREKGADSGALRIDKRAVKNFHDRLDIIAYCLMPNHFHLLVKQYDQSCIKEFMQSVMTRYMSYFNKKYSRVGTLWQGIYKASLVNDEPYFLHVSRYIHKNPLDIGKTLLYKFSSYQYFVHMAPPDWLKPALVLDMFRGTRIPMLRYDGSYRAFVEKNDTDSKDFLGSLSLD